MNKDIFTLKVACAVGETDGNGDTFSQADILIITWLLNKSYHSCKIHKSQRQNRLIVHGADDVLYVVVQHAGKEYVGLNYARIFQISNSFRRS